MSDMKCPYCDGILEQTSIYNINSYACTDLACKGYFMTATKDMWQELIRTHKENEDKQAVLNCVVDMLKVLNQKYTLIMGKDVIKETVRLLEQTKGGDNE